MEIFRLPKDTVMTPDLLAEYISKHKMLVNGHYQKLHDAYENNYDIYNQPDKEKWKPDNRISVNFAKYIVDTFNGFFIGNPIKINGKDKGTNDYIAFLDSYNDQDDNNAELSKICSIYGHGYEMYYLDDDMQQCITYLSPLEAFIIYDDSIIEKPLFFIRYYKDYKNVERGSWSDDTVIQYFHQNGSYVFDDDEHLHCFDGVPVTEYVENAERTGIFESAMPMINAYNKAISEKANDVDYFADAYLKVLGAKLDTNGVKQIRDNRIVNFEGDPEVNMVVEFMDKPNSDGTQENLIERLERLIFQISMVANISDENFGTSSGIALKYKLLSMTNLAKAKERKFTSGMNRRYKLLFSHPLSKVKSDAWVGLDYKFTFNIPANITDEAQVASSLEGIISKETQLKVLSIVDDVQGEIDRLKNEEQDAENDIVAKTMFENGTDLDYKDDAVTEVQGKTLNGAQTQSLLAIMAQFTSGTITEGQAVKLISTAIGIDTNEAKKILSGEL